MPQYRSLITSLKINRKVRKEGAKRAERKWVFDFNSAFERWHIGTLAHLINRRARKEGAKNAE